MTDVVQDEVSGSFDRYILTNLQSAFARHAGADGSIDAAELQRALGMRSEFLAQRVLRVFDRNRDGSVDRTEFLDAVRRIVFGTVRDRLEFVFALHDLDDDLAIGREELRTMLEYSLVEDDLRLDPEAVDRLTELILSSVDVSADGLISYDEFERAMFAHPQVLDLLLRSESRWIDPTVDLTATEAEPSRTERVRRYVENRRALLTLAGVWAVANAVLFVHAVLAYSDSNGWVQLARGCGACLNLNCALVFVPVLRRTLGSLRRSPLGRVLPVDDALLIHRFLGHAVLVFAVVHTAAHLSNYTVVHGSPVGSWLGGWFPATGLALLVVLGAMWLFARPRVRRSGRFELFAVTHVGYVLFAVLMLLHGRHFWMWAALPFAGLVVEQAIRLRRRAATVETVRLDPLTSGVTHLQLARPAGFRHEAGDYAFLRIPGVARREWHPFTISSAPEAEHLGFHVRSLGNFTASLRALADARHASGEHSPLTVHVDGPYSTASQEIFDSEYTVLIGAGIGVTPFASILESLVLRARDDDERLRKAYFYWLNRDGYSFEWFQDLLLRLESIDRSAMVDVRIHMTGARGGATAAALNLARELSSALGRPDLVTGLRTRTRVGAPDWEAELREIRDAHAPDPVRVFFCGPPGLARQVRTVCEELGMRFRQENF